MILLWWNWVWIMQTWNTHWLMTWTWPTWTCTFSDGACYLFNVEKTSKKLFSPDKLHGKTPDEPAEVTQFPQHLTPNTSQLHSIGPWPAQNIYLSSRWTSTHCATCFDDWLVQNGEHILMYSKHHNSTFLCPSRVLLNSVVSMCPHTSTRCSSEQLTSDAHGKPTGSGKKELGETRWNTTHCRGNSSILHHANQ